MKEKTLYNFRNDIQGLRALSIFWVVFYHLEIPYFDSGYLGVDIFFVISGFVITSILYKELEKNSKINFLNFYARRFKRLVPALACCVTVTGILSIFFTSPLGDGTYNNLLTGIGSLYGLSNIIIDIKFGNYFDPDVKFNTFLNTWSLSIEEQFYLCFSAFLYFLIKSNLIKSINSILIIVFFISFLIFFIDYLDLTTSRYFSSLSGFYNPVSRAWELLVGVLSFLYVRKVFTKFNNRFVYFLIYFGVLAIFFSIFLLENTFYQTVFSVLGASCILIGGSFKTTTQNPLTKILETKFLCFFGNISYSWYLWHWPIIIFFSMFFKMNSLNVFLLIFITLIPAILSYKYIENPIRKNKNIIGDKLKKLILITFLMPTIILSFLMFANFNGYWSENILTFKDSIEPLHAGTASGCGDGYVPRDILDKKCLWNPEKKNNIYLIGDSNADHFSEAIINVGLITNSKSRVFSKGGCPFIGNYWSTYTNFSNTECNKYVNNSVSFLQNSDAGIVFIGISDSVWRSIEKKNIAIGPNKNETYKNKKLIEKYLVEDFVNKINLIKQGGHHVVLIQPVPKFFKEGELLFEYHKYPTLNFFLFDNPIPVTKISRISVEKFQKKSKKFNGIISAKTNSGLLDLKDLFCDDLNCYNIKNNFYVYRDAGHISVQKSALLTEIFKEEIEKINTNDY